MIVGLLMLGGGAAAGVFGSLLGLGGGVLIVPLLTLGFGLPLREAVGVSLICVIMTSSAAAGVYLERHVANLRLGMTLELFTAIGALVGGSIAFLLDEQLLVAAVRRPAPVRRGHDGPRRLRRGAGRRRPTRPTRTRTRSTTPGRPSRRRRSSACPARATASATSGSASSARRAPASSRPCSGSAAGSSRCR